jgi:hypothetical protein
MPSLLLDVLELLPIKMATQEEEEEAVIALMDVNEGRCCA